LTPNQIPWTLHKLDGAAVAVVVAGLDPIGRAGKRGPKEHGFAGSGNADSRPEHVRSISKTAPVALLSAASRLLGAKGTINDQWNAW